MQTYLPLQRISTAVYGDVIQCHDSTAGTLVAMKRIDIAKANANIPVGGMERVYENAFLERDINRLLSNNGGHPFLLTLKTDFESYGCMNLVFDYCSNGDLRDLVALDANNRIELKTAQRYFYQVVLGIAHLHEKGYAHRDISLENIILNEKDECQVCDFGLACHIQTRCNERVGNFMYMAPEVYEEKSYDPVCADCWSLGVVLFTLVTGVPFIKKPIMTDIHFAYFVDHGIRKFLRKRDLNDIPDAVIDLLDKLLTVDTSLRLNMTGLLEHSWLHRRIRSNSKTLLFETKKEVLDIFPDLTESLSNYFSNNDEFELHF